MNREDFIKSLADTLKVDATTLATELSKENDIKFELPRGIFITESELSSRDENIKKSAYNDGVTVGFDKSAKKIKELSGVEIEGKDLTKITEAIISKANADAKVEPNSKITDLQGSIKKLQETVTTLEAERDDAINSFNVYKERQSLLSSMPANSVGLSNETVLAEMQANGYAFTTDGVTKNGELLKDSKLQSPLKREEVFTQFLTDKNWLKTETSKQGRGGADQVGSTTYASIKSTNDYVDYCQKNNINHMSDEGKAILIEAKKINNF